MDKKIISSLLIFAIGLTLFVLTPYLTPYYFTFEHQLLGNKRIVTLTNGTVLYSLNVTISRVMVMYINVSDGNILLYKNGELEANLTLPPPFVYLSVGNYSLVYAGPTQNVLVSLILASPGEAYAEEYGNYAIVITSELLMLFGGLFLAYLILRSLLYRKKEV
ncbi:hypothetical protein HS7_00910 [Sulfolobales archaeon HS-7]|nr:hypothetical protein HS7_00910 [Sulfolobales archaeon HS-7]